MLRVAFSSRVGAVAAVSSRSSRKSEQSAVGNQSEITAATAPSHAVFKWKGIIRRLRDHTPLKGSYAAEGNQGKLVCSRFGGRSSAEVRLAQVVIRNKSSFATGIRKGDSER